MFIECNENIQNSSRSRRLLHTVKDFRMSENSQSFGAGVVQSVRDVLSLSKACDTGSISEIVANVVIQKLH